MKTFLTRKLLLFVLVVLILVISVSFAMYYTNTRIADQNEKISEMNTAIVTLESRMNVLIAEKVQEQHLNIVRLQSSKDLLEHRIGQLENENEKLKEAVEEFHNYNQVLLEEVPAENKSSAEKISDNIGNIIKSFIF